MIGRAPDWFPDWSGLTAVIVGSGPSAPAALGRIPWKAPGGVKTIGVNQSFELLRKPDVVYGCDFRWWLKVSGLPGFGGLKISQDVECQNKGWTIRRVIADKKSDALEMTRPGFIGWAGNSGFQALNLAAQFGASTIILVGFDMHLTNGDHWHPPHGAGHARPKPNDVDRHRRATDAAADVLNAHGIRVFNASPYSALQNYPKLELRAALTA